ncbi:MAG: zinc-dependent alcohol dehydrogenase family protein [Acidobacteriia bacterium]|nr:zinc-dependent alcohol dehydrogenase family protein [Terriglobia bacterium]
MRAMVLQTPRPVEESPLELREMPNPTPGPGEVRVQVRCCGLCHTDLHTVEGDLPLPRVPVIPGHQIVGIVDAVGEGVRNRREGDRVGIPWLYSTDQTCDFCRRGLENLCEQARFTGYHVPGGYAEHAIVHEDYSYSIPRIFSDENAAPLLCSGIIGYRSYRLSGVRAGERLGLYGFGASAHLVLQLARHQGCEVYVFTRAQPHRDLAVKLGAAWVGAAEDTAPHQVDAAIIFAPAGALVPRALRALRKGGTLALAGITMSAIPQMDYSLLYQERVIRSVANSTRKDCRELLELAAEVPLRTEIEVFSLGQANEALQALKRSEIKGAGVLRI